MKRKEKASEETLGTLRRDSKPSRALFSPRALQPSPAPVLSLPPSTLPPLVPHLLLEPAFLQEMSTSCPLYLLHSSGWGLCRLVPAWSLKSTEQLRAEGARTQSFWTQLRAEGASSQSF